jgi:hypothetical protein
VDFLHQFCRPAVPKKDREVPLAAVHWRLAGQGGPKPKLSDEAGFTKNELDLIRRAYSDRQCGSRPIVESGKFMQSFKAFSALVVLGAVCTQGATAQTGLGPQGAEGEPNRLQQWLVPSPDPDTAAHALLFRPTGGGPFRLALIAHASTQNLLRRAQMPQPEYRVLAAWLVKRGFAVLVPERSGHGATGGHYLEDQGGCDEADYSRAGRATADSIVTALNYLRDNPSSGRTAWSFSGTRPAPGVRWRSLTKIRRASQASLHSHPDAAAMPTTSPIRSAPRTRWSPWRASSAGVRACR